MSLLLVFSFAFSNQVQAQKKWSRQAKDGVIGAGAGAIIGAVVDKNNRGVGALIGGAVGGGAGYLYGKHRNKEVAEDRQATLAANYKGYRTHSAVKHNNISQTYTSSDANAAYSLNDPSMQYVKNYYTNPAYGFQRKSW